MPVLELTREEAQVVECALRACVDTLLLEIANTDTRAFREGLKRRETIAHAVLTRLRAELPQPVG